MGWYNWWIKPPPPPATLLDRRKTADHVARYNQAIAQTEKMVATGEKRRSRLDQLIRERDHWLKVRV